MVGNYVISLFSVFPSTIVTKLPLRESVVRLFELNFNKGRKGGHVDLVPPLQ